LWATGKQTAGGKKAATPFIWHMASVCLEFPYGVIKHFPAGSYNEQMKDWIGQTELELMNLCHSVWYAFKHLSLSDWKEEQVRLMNWLMKQPPPELPTRRLDAVIGMVWKVSEWGLEVLENMRRYESD
jgi:hypothetical protein